MNLKSFQKLPSGVVINKNKDEFFKAKEEKRLALEQRNKVDFLEEKVSTMESTLSEILSLLKSGKING